MFICIRNSIYFYICAYSFTYAYIYIYIYIYICVFAYMCRSKCRSSMSIRQIESLCLVHHVRILLVSEESGCSPLLQNTFKLRRSTFISFEIDLLVSLPKVQRKDYITFLSLGNV